MIIGVQLFLIFLVLLGVVFLIFTKNIVHAAYALCLVLVGVAGVYVLLMSELLAVVQIMLYAGGVVILLTFGIIMTSRLRGQQLISGSKNKYLGGVISVTIFSLLVYLISHTELTKFPVENQDQVRQIGIAFLTDHILAFELIAFLLLVVLVGAAYLAKMATDE